MTAPDPGSPPHSPTRGRILLVEDNDAARRGLAKILAAMGYEVETAVDGASALEALAAGAPPDVLLTDLRLPDLDGREVALAASRLSPRPRVALITGWDLDLDDQDYSAWGIDWVFPKPLPLHDLLARLRDALGDPHRESGGDPPGAP